MTKYYRVKKDTYLWIEGAIISNKKDRDRYKARNDMFNVETDIKELRDCIENCSVPACVVENSPEWFERVYKYKEWDRTIYLNREKMKKKMEEDEKIS